MKVILKEDMDTLGRAGDTVDVKDGYARNFLLPRRKAVKATPQNLRNLEFESERMKQELDKTKGEAERLADKIENLSFTISRQAGETEKLFGSVTSMDIARLLKEEGLEIDRKKILLEEPIKSLGVYTIPIKLHPEVVKEITISIVKA